MNPQENQEKDQDRIADAVELFNQHGYALFPNQRTIYENISRHIHWRDILEAGAGIGLGTIILALKTECVEGTDKLKRNIDFAGELYPHLRWSVWDITKRPFRIKYPIVVAVEVIEHVADYRNGIKNLIASASEEVWISTPNGLMHPNPPENPFHVKHFTPEEVLTMIADCGTSIVELLDWKTFRVLNRDEANRADPMVYHITL